MAYQFQEPDLDVATDDAKKAKERQARRGFGRDKFLKFEPTEEDAPLVLRILPPGTNRSTWIPGGRIYMPVSRHVSIPGTSRAARNGKRYPASCLCMKETYPELDVACPICEVNNFVWEKARRYGINPKQVKKFLGRSYTARKAVTNVIMRGGKEKQTVLLGRDKVEVRIPKIYVAEFPTKVREFLDSKMSKKSPTTGKRIFGNITHPEDGLDLVLGIDGEGFDRRYDIEFDTERSPLAKSERTIRAILLSGYDIAALNPPHDKKTRQEVDVFADQFTAYAKRMRKIVNAAGDDDDEDDGGGGGRDTRRRRPAGVDDEPRRRRRSDDDDDRPKRRRSDDDDE